MCFIYPAHLNILDVIERILNKFGKHGLHYICQKFYFQISIIRTVPGIQI